MSSIALPAMEPKRPASPKNALGRLAYFILGLLLVMVATSLARSAGLGVVFVWAATAAVLTVLAALRLASIGWHAGFCLLGFVPFVNEAFACVLQALPANYAKERKLDSAARVILALSAVLLGIRYLLLILTLLGVSLMP